MNQEDVIRMAWEAGFAIVDKHILADNENGPEHVICTEAINRFAALVAAAEREACAELCERMGRRINSLDIRVTALEMAAENIRARSKP